jgi:hypothetical protein
MFPIFEQGHGKGIGLDKISFQRRFIELCDQKSGREKSFGLILYDFEDTNLRKVLKNQGVFAKLDRLSGDNLTLFYLDSGRKKSVDNFNSALLGELGIHGNILLPSVIFFKIKNKKVFDIITVLLNDDNILHSFQELYSVIENYVSEEFKGIFESSGALKFIKSSAAYIGDKIFTLALDKILDRLFGRF